MNRTLFAQDLKLAAGNSARWLAGRRVLITGATGLIGSFLVETLMAMDAGIHIYAAGRNPLRLRWRFGPLADDPHFHCVPYDAASPAAFDFDVDYIVHAACSAHPLAYATDPVGIMRSNIVGALGLLDYLRERPGARMVFLSSGEVYGDDPPRPEGFTEADVGRVDTMKPRACYPESKRAVETLCACYATQYGVGAVVARLCHVYGPTFAESNSRADAQFLQNALNGKDIVMKSDGAQVRSWCYVADAVNALLTLLHRGQPGQVYNVGNPSAVASIREYAQTLAQIGGVRLRFDLPSDVERAGYTRVTRAVLDPAKLEALGWRPRFDLATGLEHTFRCLSDR